MCMLSQLVDKLATGVVIWELNSHNPFDYKKMKLRYANDMATALSNQDLQEQIGSTIRNIYPMWCAKGYPKRFVQSYFDKKNVVVFDQYINCDGVVKGMYNIQCFPGENRQLLVTFRAIDSIEHSKSTDSYSIENLETKTMMLLGNFECPQIKITDFKKRSISW